MQKNVIIQTVQTIAEQLVHTAGLNIIASWGAVEFFEGSFSLRNATALVYQNKAALVFSVNGRLFSGNVMIAYNPADYYEIYLVTENETKLICPEAYFDEMADIIDAAVERGESMEEYQKFLESQDLSF